MTEISLLPPFDALWAGRDPFVEVEALQGTVYRELAGRRTLQTTCGGMSVFVKIHRGVGWPEIFKNFLYARRPVLGARDEWRALHRLYELGVPTMEALAFGERGTNPAQRHSFIVTRDISPSESLDDHTRRWPDTPPDLRWKRLLIDRVADMVRTLHGGGVNHRDLYLCHFLLHMDPAPTPEAFQVSLIDLHRAQCRQEVPRRWRDKDLASLYFSAMEIGLTQRDFYRFLRRYFQRPLRAILAEETALFRYLGREGHRLLLRYRRKFAPGVA